MNLNYYSLDPETYDSLITFSGIVTDATNDIYKILINDDVMLDVVIHPKVIDSYTHQQVIVDINDEVDMLGTYINLDGQTIVLVLRCVIYEKSPILIS